MSDDFDPEVLRELEANFRMINATAGALSGTLDKLNVANGGQSQAQKAETEARQRNTGGITASTRAHEAAAKANAEMAERQKNFGNATKSSTDALVGFTTAMIDGKGKFSDFSKGLGDAGDAAFTLGKNFGPIGAILGGLVKGATMAAQEMTRLSDAQVTLTKDLRKMGGISGASSDELFRLGNEAGITADNFGNITRMAQDASSALTSLGGTAGEGQRQMLEMFKVDKKTRMAFARTGIDLEDLQEGMKDYLKLQEASGFQLGRSDKTSKQIQTSAMAYVSNLQVLSDLTGKQASAIKDEQQAAASQLREQIATRNVEIEIRNLKKAAAAAGDPVEKARLENQAKSLQADQDMRQQFMADASANMSSEQAIQLSKIMRSGAFDKESIGMAAVGVNPKELKERFSGMDPESEEYKDEFAKFLSEFKQGQDDMGQRLGPSTEFADLETLKMLLGGATEQSYKQASKIGTTGEGEGSEVDRQRKVRYAQAGRKGGGEDGEKLIGAQVALQETQRDLQTSAERVIQSLNPLTGEMDAAKAAMVALTASAVLASGAMFAMSLGGPLGKATSGLAGMFKGLGMKASGTKLNSAGRLIDAKTSKFVKAPTAGSMVKGLNPFKGLDVKGLGSSLGKTIGPIMTKASAEAAKASASVLQASAKASSTILQKTLTTSIGPLSKVLGPAGILAVGFGEFTEFNRDKAKIDQQVADGLITNAEADEAKQNEMGEAVGSTAGAAIGTAMGVALGPLGMIVGGYIGKELGGWIGKKITEDDKPEANREDLNAARDLDIYNENDYGESEIDFDRLEEATLAGQFKPEMLEAMLLDDDLGEEDQAKLITIMDQFREAGQVFEMDKTAKERAETLEKEKLARDEETYKKETALAKARVDAVTKALDDSKKTAGTKAELDAAELAQKELGLKGEAEINALLSEASRGVIGGLDSTAEGIVGGGDKVEESITESGDKLAESGPSLMSTLFKGLLGAIPGANLLKKGMDFFKGKNEVEEETQLAEEKSTKRDMSIAGRQQRDFDRLEKNAAQLPEGQTSGTFVGGKLDGGKESQVAGAVDPFDTRYDNPITNRTRETSTTKTGGDSEAYRMLTKKSENALEEMAGPATKTVNGFKVRKVDRDIKTQPVDQDIKTQLVDQDIKTQPVDTNESEKHSVMTTSGIKKLNKEEIERGKKEGTIKRSLANDALRRIKLQAKKDEQAENAKATANGVVSPVELPVSEPFTKLADLDKTMSFDAEPVVAEEKESGPGLFAKMSEKVKSMVGGLFGEGKSPEEKIYDTSMADGSTTFLNDYSEKSPERRTRETSTTTIGGDSEAYRMLARKPDQLLAGEAMGAMPTSPDAKTLLAKDAVEESKEKGTSTTDITETKDSTTEMLETLRLIAQNGAEQNAKLSAIADASEASVTVNKKILSTANV